MKGISYADYDYSRHITASKFSHANLTYTRDDCCHGLLLLTLLQLSHYCHYGYQLHTHVK